MGFSSATRVSYYPPTEGDSVGLILITSNGNVWNSTNKGVNWTQLSSSIPNAALTDVLGNSIAGSFYFDDKIYAIEGGVSNPRIAWSGVGTNWALAGTMQTSVSDVIEDVYSPAIIQNGARCLITLAVGVGRYDTFSIPTVVTPVSTTVYNPIFSDNRIGFPASDGNQRIIYGDVGSSGTRFSTDGGNTWQSGTKTNVSRAYSPVFMLNTGNVVTSTFSRSGGLFTIGYSNNNNFGNYVAANPNANNPALSRGGFGYAPQPANTLIQGGYAVIAEWLSTGICTSVDGVNWTRTNIGGSINGPSVFCWGGDRSFIVSTTDRRIWSTTNRGSTWNGVAVPDSTNVVGLTYQG